MIFASSTSIFGLPFKQIPITCAVEPTDRLVDSFVLLNISASQRLTVKHSPLIMIDQPRNLLSMCFICAIKNGYMTVLIGGRLDFLLLMLFS